MQNHRVPEFKKIAVAPAWIPVERHESVLQEKKDAYQVRIPMQNWGTPQDITEAVLYFASQESRFVTGQYLCINGGFTLMLPKLERSHKNERVF
ncbi:MULTISPECIES: SDR family oxidoreductase [Nostocales]|uniref:SDR family oxidoreductase n=1 Tax=Nostocales TaxID=1161 RepID=UPI0004962B24|nr:MULTISPECIES: SDR family oxidoreductase [Nostocales]